MCGIAGHVSRAGAGRGSVERQLRQLEHRGPDAHGIALFSNAAIGQTRLSIIDLVTGDPPITTADGSVAGVLNGEIYNYRDLRKQLLDRGHRLQTAGDTEVLPHLIEELGAVELARSLEGMFAFATWDDGRRQLVLGRDRFGKKPLYYWCGAGELAFASEIKALLAHPSVPADLDPDSVPAYLRMGYVPTPRTFFSGIRSVPPGHVLVLDDDFVPRLEPYWEARAAGVGGAPPSDFRGDAAAQEVRRVLEQAVRRRMVADVPLGAFLSGGVDSSAIVALMATESSTPVRTFTIGFDDHAGFDERPYAAAVARRYGTDHTEFVVQPHAVDLVERLVWHHDQPFGDSSAVPTYLLSELTAQHVTVALSGDGGDELFAGYERFAAGVWANRYAALPGSVQRALRSSVGWPPLARLHPRVRSVGRFLDAAGAGLPESYRSWISYIGEADVQDLVPGGDRWAVEDYARVWQETEGAAPLDRLLLLNLRTYLLDDLLPKVDRMAMAHGLEVRSPFLDHDLAELALRLPPRTKQRGMSLKRVLRDAVRDLLPDEILTRPKHGFGVPLDRWFRQDLSAYVDATLGSPQASVRSHLAGDALDRMLGEHRAGDRQHGHALWTLLTLEVFLRSRGW